MAADGSARRKLLTLELSDLSTGPDWSPDGTRIAYSNQSGSAASNFSIPSDAPPSQPSLGSIQCSAEFA